MSAIVIDIPEELRELIRQGSERLEELCEQERQEHERVQAERLRRWDVAWTHLEEACLGQLPEVIRAYTCIERFEGAYPSGAIYAQIVIDGLVPVSAQFTPLAGGYKFIFYWVANVGIRDEYNGERLVMVSAAEHAGARYDPNEIDIALSVAAARYAEAGKLRAEVAAHNEQVRARQAELEAVRAEQSAQVEDEPPAQNKEGCQARTWIGQAKTAWQKSHQEAMYYVQLAIAESLAELVEILNHRMP